MFYKVRKQVYNWFALKSKKYSRKNLYTDLIRILRSTEEGSEILNVGAGRQVSIIISKTLNGRRVNLKSMDIDSSMRPDIVGDICEMPFPDQSLDLVIVMEVLEHVKEP